MKLTEAAGKIAEQAYKEEAAKQQGAGTSAEAESKNNDNVVDADFTEVKEESEESKAENK